MQKIISHKKAIIIFSTILIPLVLIYLFFGNILNCFVKVQNIEKSVQEQTGLVLNLKDASFKTTLNLCFLFKAKEIKVADDKGVEFFNVENFNIKIKILPLLLKKLNISRLAADKISVNIERNKEGQFNIEKYLPKDKKLDLNLKSAKINLKNSQLSFLDYKNSKKIDINILKLTIKDYKANKVIKLNSDVKYTIEDINTKKKYGSNLDIDLNLRFPLLSKLDRENTYIKINAENVDIEPFRQYINEFSPIKFSQLKGKASFRVDTQKEQKEKLITLNSQIKNAAAKYDYQGKNGSYKLNGDINYSAKIKSSKDLIKIINSKLTSKDINIDILGDITKLKSKHPNLDLKISLANTKLYELVQPLPSGLVPYKTDIIKELKDCSADAKIDGSLNLKGRLDKPKVLGKLVFDDITMFKKPEKFKLASANCEFVGDKVNVDVMVWGENSQYVKVYGVSEIYNKQAGEYSIISSDNVDLAFAHKYLIPVKKVIGFKLGPLPYMKIQGKGKINMKTSGTIYDAKVWGEFFGHGITASLEGLNCELKDGTVEIVFDEKIVRIINTNAKINGGEFILSGQADDWGNLDIETKVLNIPSLNLLNIAKTSTIIKPYLGNINLDTITNAKGNCDFTLYLKGKSEDLEGLGFLDEILPYGEILLKNLNATLKPNINLNSINGKISYGEKYSANITSKLNNADVNISFDLEPNNKNLLDKNTKIKFNSDVSSKNLYYQDILELIKGQNYFGSEQIKLLIKNTPINRLNFKVDSNINAKGEIAADFKNIDPSKVHIKGAITPKNSEKSKNIYFKSGKILVQNSKVNLDNLSFDIFGSKIDINGHLDEIFKKPKANLSLLAKNVSFATVEAFIKNSDIKNLQKMLNDFEDFKGIINTEISVKNNKANGKTTFSDISLYNKKLALPLILKSGDIRYINNKIVVNALNFNYGNTPVYFSADLENYLSPRPKISAAFTTNLDEIAADKLINPYLTYPVKIKGETILKGTLTGGINNYTLQGALKLPKETDLSYMGANIGDDEYERELSTKINFNKNIAKIDFARFIKYIPSQNNKSTPMIMIDAKGNIFSKNGAIILDNFKVATPNPTSAKLFNILFKKSVLKQGLFTCNLTLNNNAFKPDAVGMIKFQNINMPLYSTKINDMDLNITKDTIYGVMKGTSFDSDVEITAQAKNSPDFPIVLKTLDIKSKKTSLSQIFDAIGQIPRVSSDIVPGQPIIFKPQDLIILKGTANAQEVELYNIRATNLKSEFSSPEGNVLKIDNMDFDIAGGSINSKGSFDISNLNFELHSFVNDCDANQISKSTLGLENQIFGRGDAKIILKGKIPQNPEDIKNVQGKVTFEVKDGKMPKLGSLEYLLRAGNLIKSGVLGLTLNNVIEVLTPYKTGEFSSIKGGFLVKNGEISSLEIFSKGKNLSLFIYGNYNIISDDADIEVLGRLSKNVSNVLGSVGNTSLNTILSAITGNKIKEGAKAQIIENINKIPLIELSGDDYRLFMAKIKGKLNSEDYVKSFNWLN